MNKIVLLSMIFLLALPMAFASGSAVKGESFYSNCGNVFAPVSTTDQYERWTASKTGILTNISLELLKYGTPTKITEVLIFTADATKPVALIGNFTPVAVSQLTESGVWYNFSGNVSITEGNNYAIVLHSSNIDGNMHRWCGQAASTGYSGNRGTGDFSLTSWTADGTDRDNSFILWYNSTDFMTPTIYPIPTITIEYPSDNNKINNGTEYPLKINGTVTILDSSAVNSTWINDTNWKNEGTKEIFNFVMNGTITEGITYHFMVFANSSDGTTRNDTVYFTYDTTSPDAVSNIDSNNSFFMKYNNITFQINVTDNIQLYSFNLSTPEGYTYNITGLDTTKFIYNASINVSTYDVGRHYITAEYCDAHTKNKIDVWENKVDKTNMEIRFDFEEDYFSIFPLDKTLIEDVSIKKLEDRYSFTYKKNKNNKQTKQSFIVVSSQKIDILGNDKGYYGWLVIDKLKKWIDFNTVFGAELEYSIERINDNIVIIDIDNILTDEFTFNSAGDLNCGKKTWEYYLFNYTVDYDTTATATNTTKIILSINYADIVLDGYGNLLYNTTNYNTTKSSKTTQINLSSFVIPSQYLEEDTGVSFYFNYTLNGTTYQTQTYNQTIKSILLAYRGNYTNASVYNFTLYDESNNSIIEGNIRGTFHYTVGGTTLTFSPELTDTTNLSIEITPAGATTTGDFTVYYSATGYTERRYDENFAYYSNNTQTIKLYLLKEGGYATFLMLDGYSNPISDVTGSMQRVIGGSLVTVEQQSSDGSGIMTFYVNPDVDYTFTFSKTGYTTYSATIRPITTEVYTVTLNSEAEEITEPITTGVKYYFSPSSALLLNGTTYNFRFNMTSSVKEITGCTLYLKNTSTTLASSSTSYTSSGCDITISFNTGNQTRIQSQAIYIIDGETETVSIYYDIKYAYTGTFSLKNFLDDIKAFGGAGFDDFSRALLTFIIIFVIVGFTANKYSGFREPEPILLLIWALVLFFSYLGWLNLPLDYPAVFGMEQARIEQYMIFVLTTLGVGSYLIKRWA